jgi:NADH:ubiquinone oxidoreductase subunit E
MDRMNLQVRIEDLDDILKGFKSTPSELITVLQAVQEKYSYIPGEFVKPIADALHVYPSQVQGVMTFYAQFSMTPKGRNIVRVCRGTACHVRGGHSVLRRVKKILCLEDGQTSEDFMFTLETVACLGACALSPVMVFNKTYHGQMNPKRIEMVLQADRSQPADSQE